MKKRIITLVLILAMLITAAVFSANAQTATPEQIIANANAMDFSDPNNLPDYCPACGAESGVTWTAIPQNTKDNRIGYGKSGHYYVPNGGVTLAANINNFATAAANSTLCIHLNGQPVQYGSRIAPNTTGAVLNIMAGNNGTVTLVPFTGTNAAANGSDIAALDANAGELNVYGGTYITTDSTRQVLRVRGGIANLYGATIDGNAVAQSVLVASGTLNLNNTTVQNGTASYGGNIRITGGSLTMNGGTIADGEAVYYGGNLCISDGSFTINSGSITGGKTTNSTNGLGGGNICAEKTASVTIRGTEESTVISGGIASGKSNAGGGNIRVVGGTFTIEGGRIADGSATYGGGNLYITGGTTVQLKGGKFVGGSCPNKNGSSVYIYNGKLEVSEGMVIDNGNGVGKNMIYLETSTATMESAGDLLGGTTYIAANATAEIIGGKVYALTAPGTNCTITGGQFRSKYDALLADGYIFAETFQTPYAYEAYPEGVLGVAADGKKTVITTDPIEAWNTGNYAYLKLIMNTELSDLGGKTVCVDLAGNDLTVGGTGILNAFDSANDTYDATKCGSITRIGDVTITPDVIAPNGKHYIAITDGTTSMHRLNMGMKSVSLRPSAAGLYYKAAYYCDSLLSAKVKSYGVVLSVDDMPGSDFLNDADSINLYTELSTGFASGVTATSGSVFGIMKTERTAAENAQRGEMEIYANAYIRFDLGGDLIAVGDTENSGKTSADNGFTGTAWSLREVMDALDENYFSYSETVQTQLESFYNDWQQDGMGDWEFVNIGGGVDNRNLQFQDDGKTATCPVCKTDVQWTALTDTAAGKSLQGHYYLTGNLEFTGSSTAGYIYNGKANTTLCLHLNGHDITATKTRVIFGSSGRVNVMGNGEVAGYNGGGGATVQTNNSTANNGVYLYGGTWKKGTNASANAAVLGTNTIGGTIHVYKGATIEATGAMAVQTLASNSKDSFVGLYGCTVNGDVALHGVTNPYGYKGKAELVNCKLSGDVRADGIGCSIIVDGGQITGTLAADGISGITLRHDPKIGLLELKEAVLVTMDTMTDGADITVANTGIFTQPHADAASFAQYFRPRQVGDVIEVENGALRCRTDYTSKLNPDAEGKATCPVCREGVVWTAVTNSDYLVLEKGGHYYLTTDILYEAEYDANGAVSYLYGGTWRDGSACFHLNGHSITATKTHAIYGGYGQLNVMGEGVVSGYRTGSAANAAVQINNSVSGSAVNLYSGTYQKSANSGEATGVVGIQNVGGTLRIYADAEIRSFGTGAMFIGSSKTANTTVELYGATIPGNIVITAPSGTKKAVLTGENITVTGEMNVGLGNQVSLDGEIKIGKLTLPAGQTVTIGDLKEGSAITVNADGYFTNTTEKADQWLKYITCADEGDWIIEKDKQLYQGAKQSLTAANADDVTALNATYSGKTVKYGEMHNHTNTGPKGDYNTGADGSYSLAQWKAEMDRLNLEFATIVDHGQSIHMYHKDWDESYFVGGTEPSTTITDSKAARRTPHYNMLFSDPAALESIMFKWEDKYVPIEEAGYEGYRLKYASFTTAQFAQLAQDVYEAGGLLVHVHPKYNSYIVSDNPLDYYFADNTGLEISTGSGGNMVAEDNEEGYQLWVDLLQMGKKIWATAGSDIHHLPDTTALTTMYTDADHCDTYLEHMRAGNFAPGWIGIRMNIGGTAMGGQTDFSDQRLQFSVGEIYECDEVDTENTAPVYVESHTYRVELYDDSGLLMESVIDPTEMNYFAIDCDKTAMFYRVVVWDDTVGTRIGVSNPIWNTADE